MSIDATQKSFTDKNRGLICLKSHSLMTSNTEYQCSSKEKKFSMKRGKYLWTDFEVILLIYLNLGSRTNKQFFDYSFTRMLIPLLFEFMLESFSPILIHLLIRIFLSRELIVYYSNTNLLPYTCSGHHIHQLSLKLLHLQHKLVFPEIKRICYFLPG